MANPLVPMSIFKSRTVTAANLIQVLSVAGMFGIFFMGSLYLKKVLGYGPLAIGFAFLPTTVLMGALSVRYTEPLATRFGARRLLIVGLSLIGLGLVVFTQAPVDGSYLVNVAPVMVLLGVGGGLAFPSLMMLAMSGTSGENAGLASGLVNTTAQVGAALGLAVLATLSASRTATLAAGGAIGAGGPHRRIPRGVLGRGGARRGGRGGGRDRLDAGRRRRGQSDSDEPSATREPACV